jgi:hypothetical protein
MLRLKTLRFALLTLVLAIAANLALSSVTFAKDKRGRGRNSDKKSEKFVNGHDARDGRWDGRGPKWKGKNKWDDIYWYDDHRGRRRNGDWDDDDRRAKRRDDGRRDINWRNRRWPRRLR